jgi:hypothetical protein
VFIVYFTLLLTTEYNSFYLGDVVSDYNAFYSQCFTYKISVNISLHSSRCHQQAI